MSYRSLVCCLTISITMAACDEDEQVIPDRLIQIPGSPGKTVKRSDLACCDSGNCRVGRKSWQQDLNPGSACEEAAIFYADAGDKVTALKYQLKAMSLGKDEGYLTGRYNEAYGYKSHRNENDPISDSQREAEDKMISLCQNSSGVIDSSKDERLCEHIESAFSAAKREQPRKPVLKELCNNHRSPPACWELKEYNGQPFTMEMYHSWIESEQRVAAIKASIEQSYAEKEQEDVPPVEEEPAPEPVESSPSWGDAAVQAINAASGRTGQDPVQAELNRQLARINAAGRQPPPVRMHTSAPERTSSYRPTSVAVPVPSRPYESIAVVPSVPADKPVTHTDPPPMSSNAPSATDVPTTGEAQARTKSSRYVYEPGAQFDGCIGFFYDQSFHDWYSIQNSCSADIRWVMINPNGSGVTSSGGTSCFGESRSEVAQHPNRQFAFCRKGFIPVDAQDRYWTGGQYRCLASE
jgi:hypothetical protein